MDKLEKFIIENRKDFDRYEPSSTSWQKHRGGGKIYSIVLKKMITRAAIILLVAGSMITIFLLGNTNDNIFSSRRMDSGSEEIRELQESRVFYGNQLASMLVEAEPLFIVYPDISHELKRDFDDLDRVARELMADLEDNADNREVVEALIRNYRLKVSILENLLVEINSEFSNQSPHNDEI